MTLSYIAKYADIDLDSDIDIEIRGIKPLHLASSGDITFLHSNKYLKELQDTKASAILIESKYVEYLPSGVIPLITDEPYLKLAYISKLFAPKLSAKTYKPTLGEKSDISDTTRCGKDVTIGKNTQIMSGCYIGDGVKIGDDVLIYPNVTIYHGVTVKDRVVIHSGTVVGSDGYGFAHTKDGRHIKIYQLGGVVVGNDVEIGANCTIDRGALGDTLISDGTKIDNLVQIGHNCEIGENCLIVSQVGVSGSTKLGRNVVMGGQSATAGHLSIGDFATIAARGGVTKSLEGGKVYGGFPAIDIRLWKRTQAAIARLLKK